MSTTDTAQKSTPTDTAVPLIGEIELQGTQVCFTGKAYEFFKDARFRYRVTKTEGQINQEIIESVSKYFKDLNMSMDEAGAILDGQIPTTYNSADKKFVYDRADIEKLFNNNTITQ